VDFLISDTFTDSLARLTGDEQKAVKTTAFDLQLDPASPGMSFHKLDRAKDKNFWSVRVSRDIRLIVHKTSSRLLLCFAGHHDKAYDWAERRKLETHPTTGAAQLVEVVETVQEVFVPVYVQEETPAPPKPALFADRPEDELLGYGVPADWVDEVRKANEDSLFELAEHLPAEAAEALLELATGGSPRLPTAANAGVDPFEHPDAQRRFRLMTGTEELELALDYPWEKWTIFLHPDQRQWVQRDYAGPARVSGSAGTGKTIVALHRAVFLARKEPEARVLLATFSEPLANALRVRLKRLIGTEPRLGERIDVYALDALGVRLYRSHFGEPLIADHEVIRELMVEASTEVDGHSFSQQFLLAEWEQVVDGWQLDSWEAYRDVARLGRKTRLAERQREVLWAIFERVREELLERGLVTRAGIFSALTGSIAAGASAPFDFAVVDEAQDVSVSQLRFLAASGGDRPNGLFLAGDSGQRIFQQPYSWTSLGVDIRGRSRTLRVNYRTSHQIRMQADRLLAPKMVDVDGNTEDRSDTISVINGPRPVIRVLATENDEHEGVATWIRDRISHGVAPHEVAVFVRSEAQLDRARAAIDQTELPFRVLDEHVETASGYVSLSTMHLAKGLEFRAVAVMACDDEVIPLQERIETVGDEADLQDMYDTERQLLYVACTRARDHLLVTAVAPRSEFLDDLTLSG
jgi:hypothetical protein